MSANKGCGHGLLDEFCPTFCPRCSIRSESAALKARIEELEKALSNLLKWADWIKARRKEVHMNEPATGARDAAHEILERGEK